MSATSKRDIERKEAMKEDQQQKFIRHGINQRMSIDTKREFIHGVLLNHCECGMPEESLKYIQKLLNHLKNLDTKRNEDLDKFFYNNEGLKYTMYYVLDKYGLTEHTDAIPGRLTESGYELLEELNKLYPIEAR